MPIGLGIWYVLLIGLLGSAWAFLRDRKTSRPIGLIETVAVAGISIIAFAVALAPAALKPELLAAGPNWDVEIYLPMAEYLKDYPLGLSLTSPAGQVLPPSAYQVPDRPNPLLWRINFFDTRWAGLAFSLFHAGINSIARREAHQSFSAVLAVVYACSIPAFYIFYRSVLGMRPGLGLATTALMCINSSALFTVFWSFGQQASSVAVLPIAIAAAIEAHKRPAANIIVLAGLSLAALINCFTPIIVVYAAVVGIVYASWLVITHERKRVLLTGAALLAVSLAFNPWGYLRVIVRGYHFLSEGGTTGLTVGPDVDKYPPLAWGYGLVSDRTSIVSDMADSWLPELGGAFAVIVSITLLLAATAILKRKDYLLGACTLGPLLLLTLLRWPLAYPYGYLKLLPSIAFILMGVAVVGIEVLLLQKMWTRGKTLSPPRLVAFGLASTYMFATVAALGGTLSRSITESTLSYRSFEEIRKLIGPDHSVYVPFHSDLQGPKAAAVTYFLRDTQLYGQIRTGYSTFYRLSDSGVYDFALLSERDGRLGEAIDQSDAVWKGSGLVLHRWKPGLKAYQEFGSLAAPPTVDASGGRGNASGVRIDGWDARTGYPSFEGWSPPLLGVLSDTSEGAASYPIATVTRPIRLGAGGPATHPNAVSLPYTDAFASTNDRLTLTFGATVPTRLQIEVNELKKEIDLPAGVTCYSIGQVQSDTIVSLSPKDGRVFLKSLQLTSTETEIGTEKITEHKDMAVVEWRSHELGQDSQDISISYAGPALKPVLDIYRNPREGSWHLGYWEIPATDPTRWSTRLEVDLTKTAITESSRGQPLAGWANKGPEGAYVAYLFLWNSQSVSKSVTLTDFHITDSFANTPAGLAIDRVFIG